MKEYFPLAEQVVDKFHVKQVLTKALDEVRKRRLKVKLFTNQIAAM